MKDVEKMKKHLESMPIDAVYGCVQIAIGVFAVGVEDEDNLVEALERLGRRCFGSAV